MKLTKIEQLGLVGLVAGMADEEILRDTLKTTGESMASMWMQLDNDAKGDILNEVGNGLKLLEDCVENLDSEFK